MSYLRWGVRCTALAVLLLWGCGCSSTSESGPNPIQAIPLGSSNGYVLIQHPNGKLYTVQLQNGEAQAVWNLPELNKR